LVWPSYDNLETVGYSVYRKLRSVCERKKVWLGEPENGNELEKGRVWEKKSKHNEKRGKGIFSGGKKQEYLNREITVRHKGDVNRSKKM